MKYTQHRLFALFFLIINSPILSFAQTSSDFEISYDIHKIFPPFSITQEKLKNAETLVDLNRFYRPSWVKEYISVDITAIQNGIEKTIRGKHHTLTQAQKELMNTADVATTIAVSVMYMPDNTLTHNDPKDFSFNFMVEPHQTAAFPGGQQQLAQYLKEQATDKISDDRFRQYHLSAVKFTVDEEGQIRDAHIVESSDNEQVDAILLETICNMPRWKPATYNNGLKVKQEFAFTAGDFNSCVVNVLNIRQMMPDEEIGKE